MAQDTQITTTLLLERLHDSRNEWAWQTFDRRFRGVIVATGLRLGLSAPDAEEVAQETIFQALRDYQRGEYDRTRGRLSSWIVSIAHHRIIDMRRKQRRNASHGDPIDEPVEDDVALAFERSLEKQIFEQAWARLRSESQLAENTLLAFELSVLRGVSPREAAERCDLSVDQVYVARNRVTKQLRAAVEAIERVVRDGL
ncbi:MAG: sigma-70 family RNA polymerase sigma factor [Planctomycetota bacterium]